MDEFLQFGKIYTEIGGHEKRCVRIEEGLDGVLLKMYRFIFVFSYRLNAVMEMLRSGEINGGNILQDLQK